MKLPEKEKTKLLRIEGELTEHSFPPQIVIETTSYCNMKCSHCSHVELERPKAHMEESLFKKIVKEINSICILLKIVVNHFFIFFQQRFFISS